MRSADKHPMDWKPVNQLAVLLLCLALALAACSRDDDPMAPASSPTSDIQLDVAAEDMPVTQLVPATVELSEPMICGDITVYDQEDVETLCSPTTLAATPITSPTCPQPVEGSVRLEADVICVDPPVFAITGLIVVGDNTVIDLNGHKIVCTGSGHGGSCQGRQDGDTDDNRGININGHDNVHVFSHVPGGKIEGWDLGIHVSAGSDNIKVKQVVITGPPPTSGTRPINTKAIFVDNVDCANGHVRIGGGTKTGNDVSNHTRGIEVFQSGCAYVGYNHVHNNGGSTGGGNLGILLKSSPNNHIRSNLVTGNGDGDENFDAGIRLEDPPTTGNLVVENQANQNNGDGVETRNGAVDNYIVNNQMLFNTQFDASSDDISINIWNENNRCLDQTAPQPPLGVCSPDDVPPPQ